MKRALQAQNARVKVFNTLSIKVKGQRQSETEATFNQKRFSAIPFAFYLLPFYFYSGASMKFKSQS
jgi:hypothetical protein